MRVRGYQEEAKVTRQKASELFIKALEAEGVEYIFGIPGEENLDILDSLRHSSIKLILTRHEQAAGFMAATIGRLTGKAGVCLSTLGPGATNLVTPAAYAQLGAMPMLMLTGQKPIKTSKQGHFQIVDIVDMMRPLTKFSRQIVHARTIPAKVREAFRLAEQERPGAVHLELPEDIASDTIATTEAKLFEKHKTYRPTGNSKEIQKTLNMIEGAKHPLLLIGAGANRKQASKILTAFVQKTQIPFFDTQMGKGVVDERSKLYLGTAALSDHDYLHCAIDRADLIINVGHDVVEKPPFFMKENGFQVIHINFSPAAVDPVYFPQQEVIGDIAGIMQTITEQITPQKTWDFSYFKRVKEEVNHHIKEGENSPCFPLIPQRLVADARKVIPSDGIIALDNGIYKVWFARNYPAHQPNTVLLDNALATMGAGLSSAIAACLVKPDKKVVAICGDGGFMMNSQELETAVRLKLNLVVIVLNDNAFGMIKWKQKAAGFKGFGLDYKNPDFVKYAESYGAKGVRITSAEHFAPCLEKALQEGGVQLLELPVDYSENEKVLTKELKERTCLL